MKYFLSRFDAFSVREESGVAFAKEQFGINAEQVLDPVFLCPLRHYEAMASLGKLHLPETPFLGGYILDKISERTPLINALQENLNLNKTCVVSNARVLMNASIEEWLATIKFSDFFITDSFHGLCFAILFRKQFVVIFEKWQTRGLPRFKSLLKLLGLEERMVESYQEIEARDLTHKIIDYERIHAILAGEIERSSRWLKTALDECVKNRKSLDTSALLYDILRNDYETKIHSLESRLNQLEQKIRNSFPYRAYRKIKNTLLSKLLKKIVRRLYSAARGAPP